MLVKKIALLFLASTLMSGCKGADTSSSSSEESSFSDASTTQSSQEISSSSSSTLSTSENVSSVDSSIIESSISSESSSIEDSSSSSSFSSSSSQDHNSNNCQNHDLQETIIQEATIIEKGIKNYKCANCGADFDNYYYDLEEFAFENKTYMYDGKEHSLVVTGLLPYGTSVEYVDNSLTEIGSKKCTANIYDENHNLLITKEATINIVENTGMVNVRIDTSNVEIANKEDYVSMKLSTDNCAEAYKKLNITGGIRLRGNGTLTYDKKAYRIKLDDKTNLFGLNRGTKTKSWVFLADYADQSMVRNATAFYLGNSLLNYSNNYCSDYLPVNVYLNGSYNGVYLLAEQQQANKYRIKVNEAENGNTDVNVGYLLELDHYATEENHYFSVGKASSGFGGQNQGDRLDGVTLVRKDYAIKTDCFSDDQVNFIKKYLTNVYYALYKAVSGAGLYVLDDNHELVESPYQTMYETLNTMIDLESVFKMYLLHEYMKNIDVGYSSFYMFVDFSEKSAYKRLTFGAPWDFDWSSGNVNVSNVASSSGKYNSTSSNSNFNPWFFMFSRTDFFEQQFEKYYRVFADSEILEGAINQANYFASAYADDYANNFAKWKNLGQITPKYTPDSAKNFKKHQDAVDFFTNWLLARKTSLDGIYGK